MKKNKCIITWFISTKKRNRNTLFLSEFTKNKSPFTYVFGDLNYIEICGVITTIFLFIAVKKTAYSQILKRQNKTTHLTTCFLTG